MYFPEGPARATRKLLLLMSLGIRQKARLPEADPTAPRDGTATHTLPYIGETCGAIRLNLNQLVRHGFKKSGCADSGITVGWQVQILCKPDSPIWKARMLKRRSGLEIAGAGFFTRASARCLSCLN